MYLCHADADTELVYSKVRRKLQDLGVNRIVMDVDNDPGELKSESIINNMEQSWKVSRKQLS